MQVLGVTRPVDLARELALTKQAINSWSNPLTDMQRDRVQALLWRRHSHRFMALLQVSGETEAQRLIKQLQAA